MTKSAQVVFFCVSIIWKKKLDLQDLPHMKRLLFYVILFLDASSDKYICYYIISLFFFLRICCYLHDDTSKCRFIRPVICL